MKIVNVRTGAEAEVSEGAGARRVESGRWREVKPAPSEPVPDFVFGG